MNLDVVGHESPSKTLTENRTFYKVVTRNLRWKEMWCSTRPRIFTFLMGAIVKLGRFDTVLTHAFAFNEMVRLAPEEIPSPILDQFSLEEEPLKELGFRRTFAFSIPVLGTAENYAIVYSHPSKDRVAGLFYFRLENGNLIEIQKGLAISSRALADRTIYTTTNLTRRLDPPGEGVVLELISTDSVQEINDRHSEWLESSGKRFQKLKEKHLWPLIVDCHRLEIADQLERGVLVEISDDEKRSLLLP